MAKTDGDQTDRHREAQKWPSHWSTSDRARKWSRAETLMFSKNFSNRRFGDPKQLSQVLIGVSRKMFAMSCLL
jgi:hypothetical protein